jgi:hypothetical protein
MSIIGSGLVLKRTYTSVSTTTSRNIGTTKGHQAVSQLSTYRLASLDDNLSSPADVPRIPRITRVMIF